MYDFAVNKLKLHRAVQDCGPDATPDAVKARYIELGGLLTENKPIVVKKAEAPKKK